MSSAPDPNSDSTAPVTSRALEPRGAAAPSSDRLEQLVGQLSQVLRQTAPDPTGVSRGPGQAVREEAARVLVPALEAGLQSVAGTLRRELLVWAQSLRDLERISGLAPDDSLAGLLPVPASMPEEPTSSLVPAQLDDESIGLADAPLSMDLNATQPAIDIGDGTLSEVGLERLDDDKIVIVTPEPEADVPSIAPDATTIVQAQDTTAADPVPSDAAPSNAAAPPALPRRAVGRSPA